jgi:non-ribosomal peptide synthase protein (TIGR01720 family)
VLASLPAPEVRFSYLGRFSEPDDSGEPWLPWADTGALAPPSPNLPAVHLLDVAAAALAGPGGLRLSITLTWPEDAMDASGVERVGHRWAALLQMLAEHVGVTGAAGLTPSDLPLLTLTQAEIDEFQSMY